MTLAFLLYTVICFFAYGCMLRLFFIMIADGGALDTVFGWQDMLGRLYGGNKFQKLLGKALGDCKQCTSFWMAVPWFFTYWSFSYYIFDYYPTQEMSLIRAVWFHVFWYVVIHVVSATIGFAVLMAKIKKDKKDKA